MYILKTLATTAISLFFAIVIFFIIFWPIMNTLGDYRPPKDGLESFMAQHFEWYENMYEWRKEELINKMVSNSLRTIEILSSESEQFAGLLETEQKRIISRTREARKNYKVNKFIAYSALTILPVIAFGVSMVILGRFRYISICPSCKYSSVFPKKGFCPKCGTQLISECNKCEAKFKSNINNCTKCGNRIKDSL